MGGNPARSQRDGCSLAGAAMTCFLGSLKLESPTPGRGVAACLELGRTSSVRAQLYLNKQLAHMPAAYANGVVHVHACCSDRTILFPPCWSAKPETLGTAAVKATFKGKDLEYAHFIQSSETGIYPQKEAVPQITWPWVIKGFKSTLYCTQKEAQSPDPHSL